MNLARLIVDFDPKWSEAEMLNWFQAYNRLLKTCANQEKRRREVEAGKKIVQAAELLESAYLLLDGDSQELRLLAANLRDTALEKLTPKSFDP